jgi:hypothetical protein
VFNRLRPGDYDLRVSARRTLSGVFDVPSAAVRVTSSGLAVDAPASGARVNWTFPVNGWALNPAATAGTGVTSVVVQAYVSGTNTLVQAVTAVYGLSRADVATAYGRSQFTNCGYSATLTLSPGVYRLEITTNEAGGALETTTRTVTVVQSTPITSVDTPLNNSTVSQTFAVAGWAVDLGAPSGTGVDTIHVWALRNGDGNQAQFVGVPTLGGSRPDVGAVYGAQFTPSGYNLAATLTPGTYLLVVYTHSTVTNSFNLVTTVWITVQ